MTRSRSNVVRIKNYLPARPRQKSQYELYPLPFFNAKTRCTWNVTPTGNYGADFETGRAYAIEFLKSCDGTIGWSSLLSNIVADMIRAGPKGRVFADGHHSAGGIVIGFTSTIGEALNDWVQRERRSGRLRA